MQVHALEHDPQLGDLGPLAWVLGELRKSLEASSSACRRFLRETAQARETGGEPADIAQLRVARQHLHQALGALDMVGLHGPAQLLRGMETAMQALTARPQACDEAAVGKIERAGHALLEYLEQLLAGKQPASVALFPQYRDVLALGGAERVHPADLWSFDWRWREPRSPVDVPALAYGPAVRARLDACVLRIVKSGDAAAAAELRRLALGLSFGGGGPQATTFWRLCAGFFEAIALGLVKVDVYVKRAASRVLVQYAQLAKGEPSVSDRLAQDLLFFCSHAGVSAPGAAPLLHAVRQAWSLRPATPVDYELEHFGRFDPALLAQARRRIGSAKELWSHLSGGDESQLRSCPGAFRQLADALLRLHPATQSLAEALRTVGDGVAQAAVLPRPELALEVATSLLYLEAAFEDLENDEQRIETRARALALRLEQAFADGQAAPLEDWMADLYRRVSDRQTMGSVVGELRQTLSELEKDLDAYFRNPQDKPLLQSAPPRLSQMRGVLSVLGLDQAAQAVLRMRASVEGLIAADAGLDADALAARFEVLGSNLGALGFLIDMLNYQPALARSLFVYDAARGELLPLTGRLPGAAQGAEAVETVEAVEADAVPDASAPSGPAAANESAVEVLSPTATATADQPEFAGAQDPLPVLPELPGIELSEPSEPQAAASEPPAAEPLPGAQATADEADAPADVDLAAPSGLVELQAPAASREALPWPVAEQAVPQDDAQDELLAIFIEEAREVVQAGRAACAVLAVTPSELSELTVLRRAFHTLKGSSRMVGLEAYGEAAWSLEQVFNDWLSEQRPASDALLALAGASLEAFGRWTEDLARAEPPRWQADAFRRAAQAFQAGEAMPPLDRSLDAAPLQQAAEVAEDAPVRTEAAPEPAEAAIAEATPVEAALAEAAPADMPQAEAPLPELSGLEVSEIGGLDDADFAAFESAQAEHLAAPAVPEPLLDTFAAFEDAAAEHLPAEPGALPDGALLDRDDETLDAFAPSDADPLSVALPAEAEPAPEPEPEEDTCADDPVKVIGELRIGIPLYNVYLNEADEWSRRLQVELSEWALEINAPLPSSAVALAHSLAGSSATVGFHALSRIARLLEDALAGVQAHHGGTPAHAAVFNAAAEEIRRLLHQFAAGFLKEASPRLLEALAALESLPAPLDSQPVALDSQPAPLAAEPQAHAEPPRGTASLDDQREGIDLADAVDADLFPIFEEEAAELLPQLGGVLRQWNARPENRSARDAVLRCLHTLKGSARLAGALRLGEMAHRLESLVEQIGPDAVTEADLEPLLQRFDALQSAFDALRMAQAEPAATAEPAAEAPTQTEAPAIPSAQARALLAAPVGTSVASQRAAASQAVRVRSQLLDRLMNQAGEVMITRARLEDELRQLRGSLNDLTGNLDRLRTQLRDIELQAETQMQSRLAQAKDSAGFDPLEFDRFTRVQELTRMMAESVNDVATVQRNLQRTVDATEDDLAAQARQTRELQRDLLRTRMVEFEAISDRLYRVVRQASKDTGRPVRLDIEGGAIEVDRGVLDRMTPAFEHLLRNCVAHGIEDPQQRMAAGKDATGQIRITLAHEGNDVSVEFSDDGAGLDLARIRARAIAQGLLPEGAELSDADAASLIFTAGFTTAGQVTELSGRGIGMDVVRAEVNALGGRIETHSEPGRGTRFRLVLPLTTAVTQIVMIRSGDLTIGVPANVVEIVRRASVRELQQAYNSGRYEHDGEALPFFWSGALLQSSRRSTEPQGRTLPVVVFRSAAQRIALHVDEVLGSREIVVKNLGPQLSRLPGLAGMSVLPSGAVVLVYNPVALATVYGDMARALSADAAQPEMLGAAGAAGASAAASSTPDVPLVLVVDDSITVRRVTQRLLQREGWRVALAADGLQALERLAEETPALVLSDIEMPRMDGFDLVRNLRSDARWAQLPVVMITSRIAEKHREHARQLGVNHYLGKPYSEEELLGLVRRYAERARSLTAP